MKYNKEMGGRMGDFSEIIRNVFGDGEGNSNSAENHFIERGRVGVVTKDQTARG